MRRIKIIPSPVGYLRNSNGSNPAILQQIGQNSGRRISDFWISGQSLITEIFHNSRTSNDIDMKLGRVPKLDIRNTATTTTTTTTTTKTTTTK